MTYSSMKDDMSSIAGGRHKINNLFYRKNENGDYDYVGPWDKMSSRFVKFFDLMKLIATKSL